MRTIPAIYENGVFRPQTSVDLVAGAQVDVLVPDEDDCLTSEEMKRLYPNSWGVLSPDEAERIRVAIEGTRREIDSDAWR